MDPQAASKMFHHLSPSSLLGFSMCIAEFGTQDECWVQQQPSWCACEAERPSGWRGPRTVDPGTQHTSHLLSLHLSVKEV